MIVAEDQGRLLTGLSGYGRILTDPAPRGLNLARYAIEYVRVKAWSYLGLRLVNALRLRVAAEGRRMGVSDAGYLLGPHLHAAVRNGACAAPARALRAGRTEARPLIRRGKRARTERASRGRFSTCVRRRRLDASRSNPIFTGHPSIRGGANPAGAAWTRARARPAGLHARGRGSCDRLPVARDAEPIWAILAAFRSVFSLEALVTFGLDRRRS